LAVVDRPNRIGSAVRLGLAGVGLAWWGWSIKAHAAAEQRRLSQPDPKAVKQWEEARQDLKQHPTSRGG